MSLHDLIILQDKCEKLEAENAFLKESINGTRMKRMNEEIEQLKHENMKLFEALNNWIRWENGQIVMNGEYTGEDINRLIKEAKGVLDLLNLLMNHDKHRLKVTPPYRPYHF